MPNVVRFALSSARNLHVPGAGFFNAGILDVPAANTSLVDRVRYLVQPYRAVELGVTDETTPAPTLPATGPGTPNPDPYPQYVTDADLASPASGPSVALKTASAAHADILRITRDNAPPTFTRLNGGQPVFTVGNQNPAAGAAVAETVYWPYVIDARKILGGSALDEYYLYYSTDHAGVHANSGIFLATAPTLLGPWTGRGRVYRDDTGGTQTETPCVFADPTGVNKLVMLYQQAAVPGAIGGQTSLYATSNDGLAWTRGGIAIDIPTWWPSDGHTGYARPQQVGGRLVAYHLAGGWDYPTFARSHSHDGRTWWMEQSPLAYDMDVLQDGRVMGWNSIDIFWRNGSPWLVGCPSLFTSGAAVSDGRLVVAPLSRDLRRVIGTPTVQLYPTQGTESTNYKGSHTFQGRDGWLYLFYNCAGSIFVASNQGSN